MLTTLSHPSSISTVSISSTGAIASGQIPDKTHCLSSTWRIKDKPPITTTISNNSTDINSLAINNTLRPQGLPKATNHTLPRMPILRTTNNNINLPNSHRLSSNSKSTTSLRRTAYSSTLLKMKSRHFKTLSRFKSPNTMTSGQLYWWVKTFYTNMKESQADDDL